MRDEYWPDLEPETDFSIPEESSIDLHVEPCGNEAWVPVLWLWPEHVDLRTEPVKLELLDCLDLEKLKGGNNGMVYVASLDGPVCAADALARALADLISRKYELTIEYDDDHPTCVKFLLVTPGYESTVHCPVEILLQGLRGNGLTEQEQLELGYVRQEGQAK